MKMQTKDPVNIIKISTKFSYSLQLLLMKVLCRVFLTKCELFYGTLISHESH